MGQATVDLPDPLQEAASTGNTDELLSQLAGAEIDRLLAESDVEPASDKADESSPADYSADATTAAESAALNADPTPAEIASLDSSSDANLGQQLDELLTQSPATPLIAEPGRAEPPAPAIEPEQATTTAERAAIRETDAPGLKAVAAALEMGNDPPPTSQSSPIWLRPLEWLNAPLESAPDSLRDAVGKVALVTLFNAMAVLLYVLFFRKH